VGAPNRQTDREADREAERKADVMRPQLRRKGKERKGRVFI